MVIFQMISINQSINQLIIEYSGDEVVCSTTQLNSDSSVYLAGCRVGGRSVAGYTYGKEGSTPTPSYTAYQVGDHVSYNGVTYYVIEDSDTTNDIVKLLKEEPLTKTEMDNLNLTGITVSEANGYGTVEYGSSFDYSQSIIKQVVDAWKNVAVKSEDTAIARLITYEELTDDLGYEKNNERMIYPSSGGKTPSWVYNSNFWYWTMSRYYDSSSVWRVRTNGILVGIEPSTSPMVRPVIELNKSAEITKLD